MTQENKETIFGVITILFLVTMISVAVFSLGNAFGYTKGYDDALEMTRRVKCEVTFSDVPQKDISGECLKYFIKK